MHEIYAQLLLDAAKYPANYGELHDASIRISQHNASCGDKLSVALQIDVNHTITAIRWQGEGCVISRAHMSALSELLPGMNSNDVLQMNKTAMLDLFGFDETLAPGREKCLMIGLVTVQKAITAFLGH